MPSAAREGTSKPPPLAVDPEADRDSERNLDPDRKDGRRVELEDRGDDQSENRQHDRQCEKQNQQKQQPDARINQPARDLTHRLTAIAKRNNQRTEIVDGPDKDRAEQYPQQGGQPAPEDGDRGADDRSGAGDAGEVVSEDDLFLGGDEIDVVPQLPAGDFGGGVEVEDAFGKPASVSMVGDDVADEGTDGD